jgi:addiction module HigA family antidote
MTHKLKPIHPGEILREEFMIPLGLSSNALARALGVTPARVNDIARERRGITADTALRLARYFNTSHQFWMNLQDHYDVQMAESAAGPAMAHIKPMPAVLERMAQLEAAAA